MSQHKIMSKYVERKCLTQNISTENVSDIFDR